MSSGAKRLVQSLRGRNSGGGRNGGGRNEGDGSGSAVGGAASTSATRLFHYDSGHELDEISVVPGSTRGGGSEGLPTPATPCNCSTLKYGSGQTLYSIAGSVPPAPAAPIHRNAPGELDITFFPSIFFNQILEHWSGGL